MSVRAIVFAHHDVGVRCLRTLLSFGVEVPIVFAHQPDPDETPWYASVVAAATERDIPVVIPRDPNTSEFTTTIAGYNPDFIFSFYYRSLIATPLLQLARRGAFNLHGSLLPHYRGRAPVNWAIVHGETWTGATLHHMVARADAGDIVDQLAVPILRDDDAREVFAKITVAAEIVLARSLPALIAGTATRTPQDLQAGGYFGRRRPEDGRIDWSWPGRQIHNLVRAVAPPFPGAFADIAGQRWWIHRTRPATLPSKVPAPVQLFARDGAVFVACADGSVLQILAGASSAGPLDLTAIARRLATAPWVLAT